MSARGLAVAAIVALWVSVAGSSSLCASAFAAGKPVVVGESVAGVEYAGATLRARINPSEVTTHYRFEYGSDASYGQTVPVPDAEIGSGTEDVAVSQFAGSLSAGVSYHYRVVAVNGEGVTYGSDKAFKTYSAPVAESDSCANSNVRLAQFSSYLPDCRAYEMVSPVQKNGGNISATQTETQASVDGNAIKYTSTNLFGDVQGAEPRGAEYVSYRTSDGWVTHGINPVQAGLPVSIYSGPQYLYFSDDLKKGVYLTFTPLTPGHPNVAEVPNLYLRNDLLTGPPGTYELLSDAVAPIPNRETLDFPGIRFAGASADWTRIIFETVADLTPDSATTSSGLQKLYEWHEGKVSLVGILPDGEPAEGSAAGAGAGGGNEFAGGTWTQTTISSDGSRIVFTAAPFATSGGIAIGHLAGNLYMRINGTETAQLNASERATPDPAGPQPAYYWASTQDDKKVFFTSQEMLTDDAGTSANIYMYNADASAGKHLTLIAAGGSQEETAVNNVSADGRYVYFTEGNAYVWHDGAIRFLVTRKEAHYPSVNEAWGNERGYNMLGASRVSLGGNVFVFESVDPRTAEVTGHDAVNVGSELDPLYPVEIYAYRYDSDKLTCVSCASSGALSVGKAGFSANIYWDGNAYFPPTEYSSTMYLDRPLTSDGQHVFFDTESALVPQDINNRRDVYEYDLASEQVYLISGGTCDCRSNFVDASPDGSDVFFTTYQKLVRADEDAAADLYDARVQGGIANQNQAPPPACTGDDCQAPATGAPGFSLPSSSTFVGAGNAASKPTPVVHKKVKSRTKKHKAKHRKKRKRSSKRSHSAVRSNGRQEGHYAR